MDKVKGTSSPRTDNKPIIDEYRNREAEMKKHYEKQLRGVQEEHATNLDRLKKENEASLTEFNKDAQGRLSKQDMTHQEEVKELNRIHRNTLRKNAEEFEKRYTSQRALALNNVENLKDRKSEQLESLRTNYSDYIDKQQKEFAENLTKNRDDTVAAISSERRQLQESHEQDRRRIEKQRRADLSELTKEKDIIRRNKDAQIKLLEDQRWMIKADLSDKYKANVSDLQETYSNRLRDQKEGFDEGLTEVREKAHTANESQKEKFDRALSDLRQKSNERTIGEINKLERQLAATKNKHIESDVKTMHKYSQEKKEYIDQIRERQNTLYAQRDGAIADSNKKHASTLSALNKQNNDLLERQATLYHEKTVAENVINDSKRQEAVGQVKDQLLQMNTKHKVEFQRERSRSSIDKRDLEDRYQAILERMKKAHAENVLDLKSENMRTQSATMNTFSRSLKETENKNESKIQQQAAAFEAKLQIADSDMRNALAKEREGGTTKLKAAERYHLLQMKTQEMQQQNQIAQIKEKYESQLDQLRRRIEKMHYDAVRTKTT